MRQRIRSHLTYANVMVTILAFVVLGGASYAATGGNFILGKPNSASTTSSLTAPVSGKALQLNNTSTAAGATALGLNVASGHQPFTVNSGTKVANLNADKLDGIDSGGLVKGRGTLLSNRLVFVPTATKTLFVIPGLGRLMANCSSIDATIFWQNTTSSNIDAWFDGTLGRFAEVVPGQTGGFGVADSDVAPDGTLGLGLGNNPNPRTIATVHAFAFQSANGAPCGFQAQATRWTSP
jgi:hypothetical protein